MSVVCVERITDSGDNESIVLNFTVGFKSTIQR